MTDILTLKSQIQPLCPTYTSFLESVFSKYATFDVGKVPKHSVDFSSFFEWCAEYKLYPEIVCRRIITETYNSCVTVDGSSKLSGLGQIEFLCAITLLSLHMSRHSSQKSFDAGTMLDKTVRWLSLKSAIPMPIEKINNSSIPVLPRDVEDCLFTIFCNYRQYEEVDSFSIARCNAFLTQHELLRFFRETNIVTNDPPLGLQVTDFHTLCHTILLKLKSSCVKFSGFKLLLYMASQKLFPNLLSISTAAPYLHLLVKHVFHMDVIQFVQDHSVIVRQDLPLDYPPSSLLVQAIQSVLDQSRQNESFAISTQHELDCVIFGSFLSVQSQIEHHEQIAEMDENAPQYPQANAKGAVTSVSDAFELTNVVHIVNGEVQQDCSLSLTIKSLSSPDTMICCTILVACHSIDPLLLLSSNLSPNDRNDLSLRDQCHVISTILNQVAEDDEFMVSFETDAIYSDLTPNHAKLCVFMNESNEARELIQLSFKTPCDAILRRYSS